VSFRLAAAGERTRMTLEHVKIPVGAVRYAAGWHVHLDNLATHLTGAAGTVEGCDAEAFLAAYRAVEPRYAALAND
jgi:hypothetical protein